MSQPEIIDGRVVCHECDDDFARIGYHWSNGRCDWPEIPDRQESLITGMMLGDGTLRRQTDNPFIQTYMICRPFLEWIDDELGWLSTGVSLYRDAESSAEISQSNGHESDPSRYHDVYSLRTRSMKQFRRYESWYSNGTKKTIPGYLILTPVTAAIWYCCDGSLNWDRRYPGARPHVTIGVKDENMDRVLDMFEESSFGRTPTQDRSGIRFSVDATEEFLDWISPPPKGFEYKYELDSLDRYESLKEESLQSSSG